MSQSVVIFSDTECQFYLVSPLPMIPSHLTRTTFDIDFDNIGVFKLYPKSLAALVPHKMWWESLNMFGEQYETMRRWHEAAWE